MMENDKYKARKVQVCEYFSEHLSDWFRETTDSGDCSTFVQHQAMGNVRIASYRKNFRIPQDEKILFTRDTSWANNNNQGTVITDVAIYDIWDNDYPDSIERIEWEKIGEVICNARGLYFYNMEGDEMTWLLVANFFKDIDAEKEEKYGKELAKHFNTMAKLFRGIYGSESGESTYTEMALEAFGNEDYEQALKYAQAGKDDFWQFHYYRLCGLCHSFIADELKEKMDKQKEILGIDEETDAEDPRWLEWGPLFEEWSKEKKQAYTLLRQCLKSMDNDLKDGCSIDKTVLAEVYLHLGDVCESDEEKRRYLIASLSAEEYQGFSIEAYEEVTKKLIDNYDDGYDSINKALSGVDPVHYPKDNERFMKICQSQLFSNVDYHERQFIYIAKDIDVLAGCYDESIPWLFTIKQLPKELQFPVGHPQPNSLYYAHPARRGYYMPIEGADENLFNDKVQDFYRLAQGLGATEISFRLVKGHADAETILSGKKIEISGDYKVIGGSVEYDDKHSQNSKSTMHSEYQKVEHFNPTKTPYIPEDVHWLSVDDEWQRLVKMRMEGNMLTHRVQISSKQTMDVSESRMDMVKAAFKSFVAKANMSFSRQMEKSFSREEEMEYEISVTFKPLNEFESMEGKAEKQVMNTNNKLSSAEQQYLDAVKECLEDGAEITPRDRRMLERIRTSLSISVERAKELEATLAPQLTDDEKEYLEMYRDFKEDGEIGEKERRKLDRFAGVLNIPAERIKDIERMA